MQKKISNALALKILQNGGKATIQPNSVLIRKKLDENELKELFKGCSKIPHEFYTIVGFISKEAYSKILKSLEG